MKILESSITDVTVFTDRAQISRRGSVSLDRGENVICFENLPESIERNSIRVSGSVRL